MRSDAEAFVALRVPPAHAVAAAGRYEFTRE